MWRMFGSAAFAATLVGCGDAGSGDEAGGTTTAVATTTGPATAPTTTDDVPAATSGGEASTGDGPEDTDTTAPISTTATTSTSSSTGVDPDTGEPPPPDLPTATCMPIGGTWWVLEGQSIDIPVACASGDEPGEYTLDPLPAGLQLAPNLMSWTPGLDQGATYELTLTVATGESVAVTIGVIDAWSDPNNVPVVDPSIYTGEYDLPVFHLQTDPGINADDYTPATVTYRGHVYTAEAKHRGAASLNYPKKSFTLKFAKDDKFDEPDQAGGFTDKRKLVLISTFDDNTYIRQRLAYELWNELDPGHLQIKTYGAVVFLDGAYWGLYAVADHIDDNFYEDQGLAETGNVYKARTHDANFRLTKSGNNNPKGTPHDGLTKEEGTPLNGEPGAYADLDALITFVATATQQQFAAQIDGMIDRRDYEDWWMFVTLIMGDDSAGKNSYHYHDPNGGPWRFAPWDFNDSFGQTWQTARKGYTANPENYVGYNEMFAKLLKDPNFGPALRLRYGAALAGVYNVETVLDRVDELADEVVDSAHRDAELWDAQYKTYGGWNWRKDFLSHDDEMNYLRQWISDRWTFVDGIY